jgi:hypothetical protein
VQSYSCRAQLRNPLISPPLCVYVIPLSRRTGYLTKGEVVRLTQEIKNLEKDTGFRLRVLAQAYPNTPGKGVAPHAPTHVPQCLRMYISVYACIRVYA